MLNSSRDTERYGYGFHLTESICLNGAEWHVKGLGIKVVGVDAIGVDAIEIDTVGNEGVLHGGFERIDTDMRRANVACIRTDSTCFVSSRNSAHICRFRQPGPDARGFNYVAPASSHRNALWTP